MAAPRQTNRLTDVEKIKVLRVLETPETREWLDKQHPTRAEVARKLSTDLGFTITNRNLENLCDAAGITWENPNSKKQGIVAMLSEKIDKQAEALAALLVEVQKLRERYDQDVPTLRLAIAHLYTKMNHPVPSDLQSVGKAKLVAVANKV